MKTISSLAIAGLSVLFAASAPAITITESFTNDPAADGWQAFGDTNLFQWDSTNHVLDVTWDSSKPNSYFYMPLGAMLTKNDDFSFSFDLTLSQAGTGDSTGPLSMALGFLNLTNAMDPGFERGAEPSPNIAEFDYYPDGFFPPDYPSPATATPGFVDSTSSAYAPADLTPYELELPTNVLMHIALTYTASNQTAALTISTNGIPLAQFPSLVINDSGNGQFTDTNDYQVDMFSVSSYSEAGQYPPYVASIFAQGSIGNLVVNLPPPAQNLAGSFTGGNWQVQFSAHPNWLFILERTVDFQTWTAVSPAVSGIMGNMFLSDTNAPTDKGFYRVRAQRP
jgi:hypothetical protein